MAEKRGETEKMVYDFNTAGVLEVYMPRLKDWYRVTATEFRSFNGKRRISEPTKIILGKVDVETITYDYFGPVYKYGTNSIVEYVESGSIEESEVYKIRKSISENRR